MVAGEDCGDLIELFELKESSTIKRLINNQWLEALIIME